MKWNAHTKSNKETSTRQIQKIIIKENQTQQKNVRRRSLVVYYVYV